MNNLRKKLFPSDAITKDFLLMMFLLFIATILYYIILFHIVKTSDGLKLYSKYNWKLKISYVDMTNISLTELLKHYDVIIAMNENNDLKYVPFSSEMNKLKKISNNFDQDFKISSTLNEFKRVGNLKYNELDKKFHVNKKIEEAKKSLQKSSVELNTWIKEQK